jgi:hypothetical protein
MNWLFGLNPPGDKENGSGQTKPKIISITIPSGPFSKKSLKRFFNPVLDEISSLGET